MELRLTKAQTKWVDWALDAMEDYLDDLSYSGEELPYRKRDIPRLEGRKLTIPPGEGGAEALDDLVWRLRNLMADMIDDECGPQGASQIAAVERFCDKLEELE